MTARLGTLRTLSTATCRTCSKRIQLIEVGHRDVWSDGHRIDPTVCFSAINLWHEPAGTAA